MSVLVEVLAGVERSGLLYTSPRRGVANNDITPEALCPRPYTTCQYWLASVLQPGYSQSMILRSCIRVERVVTPAKLVQEGDWGSHWLFPCGLEVLETMCMATWWWQDVNGKEEGGLCKCIESREQ